MVRHIVLWKLREDGTETKEQVYQKIRTALEGLRGKIPGICCLRVERCVNPNGYDICLYSEYETMEDLNGYMAHPLHRAVYTYVQTVVCDKVVSDTYFEM